MISLNDFFLGSPADPTAGEAGCLTAGLAGSGLDAVGLLLLDAVEAVALLLDAVPAYLRGAASATAGVDRCAVGGLLVGLLAGRSTGRGEGLGELPFGRADPFATGSIRRVFAATPRRSSSAFRFGGPGLGLVVLAGAGAGASPVIDASKSPIWRSRQRRRTSQREWHDGREADDLPAC